MRIRRSTLGFLMLTGLFFLAAAITRTTALSQDSAQASLQADARELAPGAPVEQELAGGDAHVYRIRLASGQYLRAVVDQKGIDVTVRLLGPDGKTLMAIDNPNGAFEPEIVLVIAEVSGDHRLEVRSMQKVARGRYEVRIEELREATPQDKIRIAAERTLVEGERLALQGTTDSLRKAIDKWQEGLPHWQAVGDRAGEAKTLNYMGYVHALFSEFPEAMEYYNLALPLRRAAGDRKGEAVTLNNMGFAHASLGDYWKALDYYGQSLALRRAVGDRQGEALMLNNIGGVHHELGDEDKALDYHGQALALRRALGDNRGQAESLHNLAASYQSLEEYQKALEHYGQALPLWRALGNRRGEATTLHGIGRVHALSGHSQKALEYYNQALPLRRIVGDRGGEAATLHYIGQVLASSGEPQKAMEHYNLALALYRAVGYRKREAATLACIARVERDRGQMAEARAHIEAALDIIESLRARVPGQELRATFLASIQDTYEFYIGLLMRLDRSRPSEGDRATALEASERARARSLLETLTEARTDIRQGVDPTLLQRERAAQQRLNARSNRLTRLLATKDSEQQAEDAKKELETAINEYQEVQAQIRVSSPRYAALTQPQPLGLKEIQSQVLDQDTMLLEYSLGNERSYLWVVTPSSIRSFELPKRTEIESAARRFYELLTLGDRSELKVQLKLARDELSRMVLGPATGLLGNKRLLIVADGSLQYVPFGALRVDGDRPIDTGQPLIVNHEIVSLPSASTLAVLRRETAGRRPADKVVAVLADPVLESDDPRVKQASEKTVKTEPMAAADGERGIKENLLRSARESGMSFERLRFTRQEADSIAGLAQAGGSLKAVDFNANRTTAMSAEMANYRIIHFATHGLLNSQHPELSGVVLSLVDEQGKPQDGFLRLHNIYNLKLGADMVVLSACRTALGKEVKGEGLMGLTRGFMYAGAPRVVASLWDVKDEATAELMKRFYEGMLKQRLRPAAALRAAQISMWKEKRWEAPYYWAGFVLQGEWK